MQVQTLNSFRSIQLVRKREKKNQIVQKSSSKASVLLGAGEETTMFSRSQFVSLKTDKKFMCERTKGHRKRRLKRLLWHKPNRSETIRQQTQTVPLISMNQFYTN